MSKFDLDSLSEPELRELNRRIIERLKIMISMKSQMKLMAFKIGDRVAFESNDGTLSGVVTRINHKTASIVTDQGQSWRVAPSLLLKIAQRTKAEPQGNLFQLHKSNREN